MLGLSGERPETVDPATRRGQVDGGPRDRPAAAARRHARDRASTADDDLVLHRRRPLPFHPNGMRFTAFDAARRALLRQRTYYSVGGGFVVDEDDGRRTARGRPDPTPVPYPFRTGAELLAHCRRDRAADQRRRCWPTSWPGAPRPRSAPGCCAIWRGDAGVRRARLRRTRASCPAACKVPPARAARCTRAWTSDAATPSATRCSAMDWVNLYALAVNEENAAGGRVVTAPTNGAAGIIPAVLHYYARFVPGADDDGVVRFLLTAGRHRHPLQGERLDLRRRGRLPGRGRLGLLDGGRRRSPRCSAAPRRRSRTPPRSAWSTTSGLTCDPVGGLVQIPCIERNAMGAVKAINAARMALRGDGRHTVSLDKVIKTMRETGADMKTKYKETSRGGLAVNVIEC